MSADKERYWQPPGLSAIQFQLNIALTRRANGDEIGAYDSFKDLALLTESLEIVKLAEKFEDPLTMYLSDIYTVPINIGGICAVSLPCGFSRDLPVGLQIIGRAFAEETILRVAHQYEQATEWHLKKPALN